jgi:4a-hydroxytetrahydrobiopterin dehydratase
MSAEAALADKECKPCEGMTKPLKGDAVRELEQKLGPGWEVVQEHHLKKEFSFEDFMTALHFTNRAGAIAEDQNHHPEICVTYGKATVTIWTHKIDGLSENDFILAAKIDGVA